MTLACTACGASLEVAEDRIGSPNTKVACPACEHVFAVGDAAPGKAPPGKGAIPPKRVPPPVSGELTKTRRMSTDDMPFRVEMKTAPDGRQVAVVFCVNHTQRPGTYQCEACVRVYCDDCRSPDVGIVSCPDCGAAMASLVQEA